MKNVKNIKFIILICALLSATIISIQKPTIYLIGDSTVRNGDGMGWEETGSGAGELCYINM